jgi:hypothetical protein
VYQHVPAEKASVGIAVGQDLKNCSQHIIFMENAVMGNMLCGQILSAFNDVFHERCVGQDFVKECIDFSVNQVIVWWSL